MENIILVFMIMLAFGVAVYTAFDIARWSRNYKIYELTRKVCENNSWTYYKFNDAYLNEKIGAANDEYLEIVNSFRKSVGLKPLTKDQMKIKLSDL